MLVGTFRSGLKVLKNLVWSVGMVVSIVVSNIKTREFMNSTEIMVIVKSLWVLEKLIL